MNIAIVGATGNVGRKIIQVLEKKNRNEIKGKDLPKNKNPDVEINTDDVSKTEVDEIVADQIESKEKKE